MQDVSLKIKNYKCFGEPEQGFDRIYPVNLIIGKNNSGKSALLDLVEHADQPNLDTLRLHGHLNRRPEVFISSILSEERLKQRFNPHQGGGGIPGNNHWEFGQKHIGMRVTCKAAQDSKKLTLVSSDREIKVQPQYLSKVQDMFATAFENPFSGLIVKRLAAERDITREPKKENQAINNNGTGATDVIRAYLNQVELPSDLVEQTLLNELNTIFEPDSRFNRILVQEQDGMWEVYLEQENLGRLALSDQGSGLKTIILTLLYIHVLPQKEGKQPSQYIFCLEELENNIHPSLLRRLLTYLRNFALANSCRFFLTTHSNAAIDVFAGDLEAQILHVHHDGTAATVIPLQTYTEHCGLLNDLGVKASDLLQANGVIWVEGPSDRIYFNRWIKIWSEGQLKEGAHYQCVFYGGKLLSHLAADEPEEEAEAVKILSMNRNAIIIMDRDTKTINKTKRRISEEIERLGSRAWLTAGKEIENYIPHQALIKLYGNETPPLEQFADFSDYLESIKSGLGKTFSRNKPGFAADVAEYFDISNLTATLDLAKRLDQVVGEIRTWNM